MNFRNKNKISDKEILTSISKAIYRPIKNIAKEIDVRPERLYEVSSHGRNKLSKVVIRKMLETYKNINPDYLQFGKGEVLIDVEEDINNHLEMLHKKIDYLMDMVALLLKNQKN